ncbi:DUF4349 domain-containing protein [Mycobacterium sp. NAZ190054]|uniref:DUF4349 domain-containing protein n=1 Tax=Mycobacterium sp. NAZ190054 TaxID=1747766 RepID=UPI00079C53CE|nr:DUF4349 domain-containing protein [Mycobacterium sp. NAZ190054]KWX69163.1 hypothetical protein ASJ79_14585 [Mycobacterium sp. NAZ190054]
MPAGGSASSDAVTGVAPEFGPPQAPPPVQKRDVVKTASMTVTVPDPSAAADEAAVIAERNDGRVDSRSEDAGSSGGRAVTSIVLRVPADDLDEVLRQLKALGTVETATTTAEDVTTQRVDLDARIRALQTSVDRLLAIMSEARDPEALIQAESALSQRQADLDSLRAQREALGDRIAYSTIEASFHAEQIGGPAPERYEGFLGQVERGWDGLVAVAGGAVLLLGLLLPWLGVLLVVGLVIFGLVRATQRRPAPVAAPAPTEPTDQPDAVERDG